MAPSDKCDADWRGKREVSIMSIDHAAQTAYVSIYWKTYYRGVESGDGVNDIMTLTTLRIIAGREPEVGDRFFIESYAP
jgi:hypothetical protein